MTKPILTIFYQYNPWFASIGGIQTVISNFIKYAPDSFDIRLVGTNVDPKGSVGQWTQQVYQGKSIKFFPLITVVNDDTRGLIPTTLKFTWALRRYKFESDFMHFHRIEPALVTGRWRGEKSLFIHNDVQTQISKTNRDQSILWQRFPWLYYKLEASLIRQFSKLYSCNTQASHFYKTAYPEIAGRVIPYQNPVDVSIFHPLSNQEQQYQRRLFCQKQRLPPDRQFLLFAGRLHPQKDPLLLLEAIEKLKSCATLHLLMVGEGELKAEIQAKIRSLGLEERVSVLGGLSLEALRSLYQISSAFILTSVYEGQPITVLEALACGIPVISTNCGETPRLLNKKTGKITERSSESIAIAIQDTLEHPDQFSAQACIAIAKAHSAQSLMADIYQQMYQRWRTTHDFL